MSENTIDPSELTSPGTVHDPALEERRAREAAVREVAEAEERLRRTEAMRRYRTSDRIYQNGGKLV